MRARVPEKKCCKRVGVLDLRRGYEASCPPNQVNDSNKEVSCCLLLQDLYESCARGGSEKRGRVLWDATSRGLCGRVGPPRTNVRVAWANCERGQSR